ncbi:MAG: hypothetical protein J2P36_07125, partial [Ktedonobacteraceae bacterium]|nr:hypothetical protein [Ktedonobacteraceae bacterium]
GLLVSLPAVLWPLWRGAFRPSAREMAAQSRPSLTGGPTFLMGTRSAGGEPDGLCIPTPNDASESTAAQSGDREGIPRKGGPYISWGRGIYGGVRQGVILLVGVIYLVGTLSIFTGYPPAPQLEQRWGIFATQVNDQHLDLATVRALNERQYSLIRHLLQARIVHIYSDYWTCNRLIFQSKERIICAVIDLNKYNNRLLRTGQNRYLPYLEEVRADKHETYVLELGSPLVLAFESIHPKRTYHYRIFDGYGIYQIIS